ncbi:MAG: hypothetical protein V1794_04995 [Candidatus Glassbacteria bacterium]
MMIISGEMIDDCFKREGLHLGAAEYLGKPVDMDYLLERVDAPLGA